MTPVIPEALPEQFFSKKEFGYDPEEVDAYIRRLTENYTLLYRENASLLKQLREMSTQIRAQEHPDLTLQAAQAQRDKIIQDAYLKADNILASVQMHCDSILLQFKEKAEEQAQALSDMKKNILKFKHELFEYYRLHIEWIENIFPDNDEEEDLTPEAYATHIVEKLKKKFSDQYEIFPETQMELHVPSEFKKESESEKFKNTSLHPSAKKKIVKKMPSVMDLIDEYEDSARHCAAKSSVAPQFMLDFDHPSEEGITIDKRK